MKAAQARPMQSLMLVLLDDLHYAFFVITLKVEIERTVRCCSETESVTAQICSNRNRTEPHTQIHTSRRGPPKPQTAVAVGAVNHSPAYNNNNNNNNQDDIYGAVIMAKPLREFTRFI